MKTTRFAAVIVVALAVASVASRPVWSAEEKREPVPAASTEAFEIRNIEGWIVYIDKTALAQHDAEMKEVIRHLHSQLYQVRVTLPAAAVAVLQERVPLWVQWGGGPGIAFHPDYHWLLNRGYACPRGLKSLISLARVEGFCHTALHQPWVVGHELTHGYDYLYLGEGGHYTNARLKAVYEHAKKGGAYESVLCRYSNATRHYGMNNPMEYFAENTEAYFGANDFYPFVRAELKEHDRQMYALLQDLWGVDVQAQNRRERSLARFLESPGDRSASGGSGSQAAGPPADEYDKRAVEGWTVYVHPDLVRRKAYGDAVCRLLRHKLHLVTRYMPEASLDRLRQVPIYLEKDEPAVPYITYFASAEAVKAAAVDPAKLHAVVIGNPDTFRRWQALQPFVVMNKLARAYYDRCLSDEETAEVKKAWQRAGESKKYDSVLRFDGRHVRHPALAGPVDFFAEMTESYYGVNDHYPFLQFETRQHDPETCELLAKLWGGKAK